MINEGMAKTYWPGTSAIGHRLRLNADAGWLTVIGVVRDITIPSTGAPKSSACGPTGPECRTNRLSGSSVALVCLVDRLPCDVSSAGRAALPCTHPQDLQRIDAEVVHSEVQAGLASVGGRGGSFYKG